MKIMTNLYLKLFGDLDCKICIASRALFLGFMAGILVGILCSIILVYVAQEKKQTSQCFGQSLGAQVQILDALHT
jgi:MFS superfamily sulfate permease-like transporter